MAKTTKPLLKIRNGHDSFLRREEVIYLIKSKGYNQKEAAQKVNVSEKTVGKWMKKEPGKKANLYDKKNEGKSIAKQFLLHIYINSPLLFKKVNKLWESFCDGYKIVSED